MNNGKKLTLDDVLLKLQQDHSMSAVTELEKITGGVGVPMDGCHTVVATTT